MKGLLIKDFQLYLRVYGKSMLFLIALFTLIGFFTPGASAALLWAIPLYGVYLSSVDNTTKWDFYTCALPVSRTDLVNSRYVFVLLLFLASMLLNVAIFGGLKLFFSLSEPLALIIAVLIPVIFFGLAMFGLMIALNYKFGPNKARIYTMLLLMIPAVFFIILNLFDLEDLFTLTGNWLSSLVTLLILSFSCILIFALSWLWSISICKKREL